jgi:hypothetical protein
MLRGLTLAISETLLPHSSSVCVTCFSPVYWSLKCTLDRVGKGLWRVDVPIWHFSWNCLKLLNGFKFEKGLHRVGVLTYTHTSTDAFDLQ